jgi:hypothetical protein
VGQVLIPGRQSKAPSVASMFKKPDYPESTTGGGY